MPRREEAPSPSPPRGCLPLPSAAAACLLFLLFCTRALALNVAAEDAKDPTELLLQTSEKHENSSEISKELKEIVFIIQSQRNSFHSKKADDLKQNILNQAAALGKELKFWSYQIAYTQLAVDQLLQEDSQLFELRTEHGQIEQIFSAVRPCLYETISAAGCGSTFSAVGLSMLCKFRLAVKDLAVLTLTGSNEKTRTEKI